MVVDLEEDDEDRLRRTMMTRTTTTRTTKTRVFLLSQVKQKILSKAKKTPAEQRAMLIPDRGVQF